MVGGRQPAKHLLRTKAYGALRGVGLKGEKTEWHEWTGRAYHIRRRLTPFEQTLIGEAVDCRGTDEAAKRFEACRLVIPAIALKIAKEEMELSHRDRP